MGTSLAASRSRVRALRVGFSTAEKVHPRSPDLASAHSVSQLRIEAAQRLR